MTRAAGRQRTARLTFGPRAVGGQHRRGARQMPSGVSRTFSSLNTTRRYRRAGDFPSGTQTLSAMGALAVLDAHDKAISPGRREMLCAKVREAAMSSIGTLDYYRAYFLTAALKEMPDEASVDQRAMIRGSFVSSQVALGTE